MKKFQKIFGVFEKRRIAPRKGGKHHQLSNEKGGENVEPNSREFYKQCAFQKFCNTVLHNEACDTHRELRRHKAKEVTFSDMTLDEARQLHMECPFPALRFFIQKLVQKMLPIIYKCFGDNVAVRIFILTRMNRAIVEAKNLSIRHSEENG